METSVIPSPSPKPESEQEVHTCSVCGTEIVGDFETGDVGCQGAH